jgi:hypothetical protein
MRKVEFAAHTILATMDVLSTVFKTREHTAHVRVEENSNKLTRSDAVPSGCLPVTCHSYSRSSMLEQIPLPGYRNKLGLKEHM